MDITSIQKKVYLLQSVLANQDEKSPLTRRVMLLARELFPLLDNQTIINQLSDDERRVLTRAF